MKVLVLPAAVLIGLVTQAPFLEAQATVWPALVEPMFHVPTEGFEPPTSGSVDRRCYPLSYVGIESSWPRLPRGQDWRLLVGELQA